MTPRQKQAHEAATAIASLVAKQYHAGATLQEAADWLTRHRVLTPAGRLIWSRQAVHRVLRRAGLLRPRRAGRRAAADATRDPGGI
jgi:hypothetical protein